MKMSDEQAAQILTVGQAVDFVLAHAPSARPEAVRCSSSATCSTSCPRTSPARSSPTPRGPSGASDSYARLAFLGDSVLGAGRHRAPVPAAGGRALRRRPADEDPRAGRLRAVLPRRRRAARRARAPARRGARGRRADAAALVETERVLASVIEAVIGACYLHAGYERTAEAVVEAFAAGDRAGAGASRSTSSRRCRSGSPSAARWSPTRSPPSTGPPHDRTFEVAATVDGQRARDAARGRSKKHAEQEAAREALESLLADATTTTSGATRRCT